MTKKVKKHLTPPMSERILGGRARIHPPIPPRPRPRQELEAEIQNLRQTIAAQDERVGSLLCEGARWERLYQKAANQIHGLKAIASEGQKALEKQEAVQTALAGQSEIFQELCDFLGVMVPEDFVKRFGKFQQEQLMKTLQFGAVVVLAETPSDRGKTREEIEEEEDEITEEEANDPGRSTATFGLFSPASSKPAETSSLPPPDDGDSIDELISLVDRPTPVRMPSSKRRPSRSLRHTVQFDPDGSDDE